MYFKPGNEDDFCGKCGLRQNIDYKGDAVDKWVRESFQLLLNNEVYVYYTTKFRCYLMLILHLFQYRCDECRRRYHASCMSAEEAAGDGLCQSISRLR